MEYGMIRYRKQISGVIKTQRLKRRMTQSELAKNIGISQSRLSELENGKGSFTAEHLLIVLQLFNLTVHDFIQSKLSAKDRLQKAMVRLGATHLREDGETLPSENITHINDMVIETLLSPSSTRFVTGLAPLIVKNNEHMNLNVIMRKLLDLGYEARLGWVIECTLESIKERLDGYLPKNVANLYRRAHIRLSQYHLDPNELLSVLNKKSVYLEDFFDRDILSQKTVLQVKASRDTFAKKWHIITRITQQDFTHALIEAEKND